MTEVPHYRDQPATLDPNVTIPDDADAVPLAQGHTAERASDVAAAADEHRETVHAEAKAQAKADAEAAKPKEEPKPKAKPKE